MFTVVSSNNIKKGFGSRQERVGRVRTSSPTRSVQPYRTGYHFQPKKNYMNDPNGPMIYNGIYHLFYQYNPTGTKAGIPVWGHSTSSDLVNWTPQPVAIQPQMKSNLNGSWSGSSTILLPKKDTPAILFTGINPKLQQAQNLAFPSNLSDPFLRNWTLIPENPVMSPAASSHINATAFRDPSTAWFSPNGKWKVTVGSKKGKLGMALLFESVDFINWTLIDHPLYAYQKSRMWECPDFYPVYINGSSLGVETSTYGPFVRQVFKVSLDDNRHDIYTIGSYDTTTDEYTPDLGFTNDSSLRYDYGNFYASKSFFDESTTRRILFGWVHESCAEKDDRLKGWSGIQAVPRRIWLDVSGKQLVQWPIEEIDRLRENPIRLSTQVLKQGSLIEIPGVTAAQADVSVSFKINNFNVVERLSETWTDPELLCTQKSALDKGVLGPFGLMVLSSKYLEEFTALFFRVFKTDKKIIVLLCSDQSRSSLHPTTDKRPYGAFLDVDPVTERLSLRALIDHSVVETYGGQGKTVITARVYPRLAILTDTHLRLFNFGSRSVELSEFTAWSMKTADIA